MLKNYDKIFQAVYRINDIVIMFLALCAGHFTRFSKIIIIERDFQLYIYSILVWLIITRLTDFYKLRKDKTSIFISIIQISILFFLAVSMFAFFFKSADYSRLLFIYYSSSMFLLLIISHFTLLFFIRRIRQNPRKVRNMMIIGAEKLAEDITSEIDQHPEYGLSIVGYLSDNSNYVRFQDRILGRLDELDNVLQNNEIHEVIITLPLIMADVINVIIRHLEREGIRVQLVPDLYRVTKRPMSLNSFGKVPILTIHTIPMDNLMNRFIKRTFDLVFSFLVLLIMLPLLLVIAILIKLTSKGPVFFIQNRTGYSQRIFKCYKFRSMQVSDQEVADTVQCTDEDLRRTGFGEFLRRTNLDELPQFLNVLIGDMSVVGPRPHMLSHTKEFRERVSEYLIRHYVKPGITGWAQVHGWRGPTDTDEKIIRRVEHDLWYIENWSFWLDAKIIMKTVLSKQSRLNAY